MKNKRKKTNKEEKEKKTKSNVLSIDCAFFGFLKEVNKIKIMAYTI